MNKIQRNIMAYIPFKVIPITAFNSILPHTIDQCVHLTGKQIGKCKTTSHK